MNEFNNQNNNNENNTYNSGYSYNSKQLNEHIASDRNDYSQNTHNYQNNDNNQYGTPSYSTAVNGGNNTNGGNNANGGNNEPPKKAKSAWKKVVAAVLAIAVVGGASGFGGAFIAGNLLTNQNAQSSYTSENNIDNNNNSNNTPSTTDNNNNNAPETSATTAFDRPETSISEDLLNLDNMATSANTTLTAEELYEKYNDAIVIVNNYQRVSTQSSADYFGFGGNFGYNDSNIQEPQIQLYGTGSGVVITTDGYIVTNYHVIEGAERVTITIDDYSDDEDDTTNEIEAVVVGSDESTDLAVLKVTRNESFVAAPLGDSDTLKVGQSVCAIGNPSGLSKTITGGMISGLNRHYSSDDGYELSSIQTDTAINPGNSGGALFDMYGNVVGIVNAKIVAEYTENLGFAITINEAKPVISDLINYGYVTGRPILGVTTVALNEYTSALYGFSSSGLLINSINEDAPVSKSKLRLGDIVIAVNGTEVTSVSEVQSIIKNFKAGDTVTLTVVRDNQETGRSQTLDIDVILTENTGN